MEKNAAGSLWRVDLASGRRRPLVAGDLAFPYGVLADAASGVIVSESWRHRLRRASPASGGAPMPILSKHLPGYPARLSPAADGGAWLALFAPRNRLIEFVLQEDALPRRHDARGAARTTGSRRRWPPSRSFLEPLQCGGVKTMGIHKPWSPSRSYGLVVRLDAQAAAAVASFHSRANGTRHGITSVVEVGGRVLVASQGRRRDPGDRRCAREA